MTEFLHKCNFTDLDIPVYYREANVELTAVRVRE